MQPILQAALSKEHYSGDIARFLKMIATLNTIAGQPLGKAVIPEIAKPILSDTTSVQNTKFLFATGRELEFKDNTSDAALLYSKIKDEYSWDNNDVFWKTKRMHHTLYADFYYDYFFYIDAWYTPQQLAALIQQIESNTGHSKFNDWLYAKVKSQLPRLYDLLGTKYIRKNQLENAKDAFSKVVDTLWTSQEYPFITYLDANPFYTNMYNEHNTIAEDSISYNKLEITEKLLEYLHRAANTNNTNREYDYFVAANCYLNMTQYGNSWMMRRYYWTNYPRKTTGLEDDDEYYKANLAKQYYLKAKEVSKNEMFAALCLRMAGRCEKYALLLEEDADPFKAFKQNKYYTKLKQEYPQHYEELVSNCQSFNKYFAKWQAGNSK